MSWDLDVVEAKELAAEYIAAMDLPTTDEWLITKVDERDWGWVIFWLNKRAAEGSRLASDLYAGAGPLLIDRKEGRVALCGSARSPDYYIDLWRRGELPNLPRPA